MIMMGKGDRRLSRYEVDRLTEERRQPRHDAQVVECASSSELDPELVAGFLVRERAASSRVFSGRSTRYVQGWAGKRLFAAYLFSLYAAAGVE